MTSPFDQAYASWFVLYIRSAKSNLEMLTFNINLSNVIKHIFNKLKKMEEIMHSLCLRVRTTQYFFIFRIRRNGTLPLCDVLPFEINNENAFSLIALIWLNFYNFPRSLISKGCASNPLFFISLFEFCKCILGANVKDFKKF